MKCFIGVLATASLCLAKPEADAFYSAYGYLSPYPYYLRPYAASGYAGPLPGASYQSVHRLHKREAEADPQILLGAAPYVNDGPVSGPLTAAFGDLVSTPRGLVSKTLEGFSEDLNMDGFVDPVAQAAPVVAPVAPIVTAVSPVIRTVASPIVSAPAPLVSAPATVLRTVAAPFAPLVAAPAPVVRTVAAAAPVALTPHDCVTPHGCAVKAALIAGTRTGAAGHVTSTIVKREAEAEADADADAFYYSAYSYAAPAAYPYSAYNPFYNYFGAYAGYPYTYGLGPYTYPYAAPAVAAPAPVAAPVVEAAPVVKAAPVAVAAPAPVAVPAPVAAPLVKSISKPVTYTHIGAHPVNPTTVIETETFF